MEDSELGVLLRRHHKPELERKDGMVYQVWEDGEITLQKSGHLMWQRSLHTIEEGEHLVKGATKVVLPCEHNNHTYVVCADIESARKVRQFILDNNFNPNE